MLIYLVQNLCQTQVIFLFNYKSIPFINSLNFITVLCLDDRGIVSCSGDGIVLYTELTNRQPFINQNDANLNYFNCHSSGTTYEVLTVPTESNSFMSCGEDGTVRLFDLRQISRCL